MVWIKVKGLKALLKLRGRRGIPHTLGATYVVYSAFLLKQTIDKRKN